MSTDFWDSRYSEPGYAYGTEPNAFIAEQLPRFTPGSLLLPGEGQGRNALFAARSGWDVTAFDQSREAQKKALRLLEEHHLSIRYDVSVWKDWKHEGPLFDALALSFIHMPADQRHVFHRRMLSFVKPGGVIIIEGFSTGQLLHSSGGPREEAMLFTTEIIKDDFADCVPDILSRQQIVLNEGPYHQGTADVVRFVGIRR